MHLFLFIPKIAGKIERKGARFVSQCLQSLQKNYYFAKVYNQWLTKRYVENKTKLKPPLLVYSMPKAGTSSVLYSLRSETDFPVLHIHTLRKDRLLELEKVYKKNWSKADSPTHLWHSFYLLNKLDSKRDKNDKFKIISLVRDPVAKRISSFFEILYLEFGYNYNEKLKLMHVEDVIDELISLFINKFSQQTVPREWFELELNGVFDIDIYTKPFSHEKGYQIYEGQQADVLLIRLEDLDRCSNEAFRKFIDIENFSLIKKNVGSRKDYAMLYKSFLAKVVLPESYLLELYNIKHVQHLYSPDEIIDFKKKWRTKNL